ncbi:predicted protein [Chaetomium globosum CBS 148.51]|uniref:Uncharacterized protein n=1 Tax=Chaetomium globosum (strain ATCC 6205 / CBS 148.51 / DSM 1962 / NBRC 6347 / NRRL 1970) TaxID=306901 RepID=Q2GP47_CHAGB|nr:uncharacterized protein CHGG_10257 [Chaetomium globosum CBS 148.51]EAQ83853.1 predicted protein [Chaetomium globosum CBS 148.51]
MGPLQSQPNQIFPDKSPEGQLRAQNKKPLAATYRFAPCAVRKFRV